MMPQPGRVAAASPSPPRVCDLLATPFRPLPLSRAAFAPGVGTRLDSSAVRPLFAAFFPPFFPAVLAAAPRQSCTIRPVSTVLRPRFSFADFIRE
jgi:hypothetical protein